MAVMQYDINAHTLVYCHRAQWSYLFAATVFHTSSLGLSWSVRTIH